MLQCYRTVFRSSSSKTQRSTEAHYLICFTRGVHCSMACFYSSKSVLYFQLFLICWQVINEWKSVIVSKPYNNVRSFTHIIYSSVVLIRWGFFLSLNARAVKTANKWSYYLYRHDCRHIHCLIKASPNSMECINRRAVLILSFFFVRSIIISNQTRLNRIRTSTCKQITIHVEFVLANHKPSSDIHVSVFLVCKT